MKLKIENGQLLTPYAIPWSPDGWVIPNGWTPDRTPEMTARVDELQVEHPEAPVFVLWEQVEHGESERRQTLRRPWPGWVMLPGPHDPRATRTDRRISKAYRALFVKMNPQHAASVKSGKRPLDSAPVEWPPDGDYVFRGGKMTLVKMPVSLGNRSVLVSLTDPLGISSDDVRARIEELKDA